MTNNNKNTESAIQSLNRRWTTHIENLREKAASLYGISIEEVTSTQLKEQQNIHDENIKPTL